MNHALWKLILKPVVDNHLPGLLHRSLVSSKRSPPEIGRLAYIRNPRLSHRIADLKADQLGPLLMANLLCQPSSIGLGNMTPYSIDFQDFGSAF